MEENKDIWNGGIGHDIKMDYNIKFDPSSAGTRITSWKDMNESSLYRFFVGLLGHEEWIF